MLRARQSPRPGDDKTWAAKDTSKQPATGWQRIQNLSRIRWALLSRRTRWIGSILAVWCVSGLFLQLGDWTFRKAMFGSKPIIDETQFAVVINTYKRPEELRQAIQHYGSTCGPHFGVDQVFVVWAELDVTPPDPASFYDHHHYDARVRQQQQPQHSPRSISKTNAALEFLRVPKDSLNSRFLPIDHLQWTAIFMVDDDIRVSCRSLQTAFAAWRVHPDSMVGYYPRLSVPPRGHNNNDNNNNNNPNDPSTTQQQQSQQQQQSPSPQPYIYHSWPMVFARQQMNFILTKACFLHRRYLELYSSPATHPTEILDYVDRYKNCEDVAMSLLVANVTRSSTATHNDNDNHNDDDHHNHHHHPAVPIYVEGSVTDRGLFGGISTGPGHMHRRSECLVDLTHIYQQHGWSPPLSHVFAFRESAWVQHWPGFWWQARPSNVFEWFALGNVWQ